MRPVLLTVCASPDLTALVRSVGSAQNMGVGHLHQYLCNGHRGVLAALDPNVPCIAVIDMGTNLEHGIATAEAMSRNAAPRIYPIAVSPDIEKRDALRLMRAGCAEYLSWPTTADALTTALGNVIDRLHHEEGGQGRRGRVIAVGGVRGGAGATTVAAHLGLALMESQHRVLMIDHHRYLGHLALYLGLPAKGYSFPDLLNNADRLDKELLDTLTAEHNSGLRVVCSEDRCPRHPSSRMLLDQTLDKVFAILRGEYDEIVVDLNPECSESLEVARRADQIVLVATPDIASLRGLDRYGEAFGRDADKHKVVVNRLGNGVYQASALADAARLPLVARIPDLGEKVTASVDAGKPVPRQVRLFYEGIAAIAASLEVEVQKPARKCASLFGHRR